MSCITGSRALRRTYEASYAGILLVAFVHLQLADVSQYHDSDFLAIGKSTLPAKNVVEATFLQRWRRPSLVKVIRYDETNNPRAATFSGSTITDISACCIAVVRHPGNKRSYLRAAAASYSQTRASTLVRYSVDVTTSVVGQAWSQNNPKLTVPISWPTDRF